MNVNELGDNLGKIAEILTEPDNFELFFTKNNFFTKFSLYTFFYRNERRKLRFSLNF